MKYWSTKGKCHLRILILGPGPEQHLEHLPLELVLAPVLSWQQLQAAGMRLWLWPFRKKSGNSKIFAQTHPNSVIHRILAGFKVDNGASLVITMWSNWSFRILDKFRWGYVISVRVIRSTSTVQSLALPRCLNSAKLLCSCAWEELLRPMNLIWNQHFRKWQVLLIVRWTSYTNHDHIILFPIIL